MDAAGSFAFLVDQILGERVPVFKRYVRLVGKALALVPRATL